MKTKNIFKIIIFILLSGLLLISLSGCTKSEEIKASSNLEVDTSYNATLASINKILERNEEYEKVNSKIKNLKFDNYSYTLNVFCSENNDKQISIDKNKRVARIENIINLHKINFLTANFNLI